MASWSDFGNFNMISGASGAAKDALGKNTQAPTSPDYTGAANAQSYGSIQSAIANNLLAHPDVKTPLGSETWNQSGKSSVYIPGYGNVDIPTYTQNINMSPEQKALYDKQVGISGDLLKQAGSNLSNPSDLSSIQDVANKSYQSLTARLDPQWSKNEELQKSQLANQGLTAGGEAYDDAMRTFNQGKNDAYQQANLAAISTMPQTFQLSNAIRDQPLAEMSALSGGSQVNMPQFQPVQFPGQMQGTQNTAATQAQGQWDANLYNQQIAQQNALTSGLFGIAGLGAYGMMKK